MSFPRVSWSPSSIICVSAVAASLVLGSFVLLNCASKAQNHFQSRHQNEKIEQPGSLRSLSKSNLSHGEQQVRALMRDRPALTELVSEGDIIWSWTVRQFAGERLGYRIWWQKHLPRGMENVPVSACSSSRTPEQGGYVFLREHLGRELIPSDDLWSALVFELHNISNQSGMSKVYEKARQGRITKEQYIGEITSREFKSKTELKKFFLKYWLPHSERRHFKPDRYNWGIADPDTYDQWIAFHKRWNSGYLDLYAKQYSDMVRQRQNGH